MEKDYVVVAGCIKKSRIPASVWFLASLRECAARGRVVTTSVREVLTQEQLEDPYWKVGVRLGEPVAELLKGLAFEPFEAQLNILAHPARLIMVSGGLQSGKTALASKKLAIHYYRDLAKHPPRAHQEREYWICGHRLEDTTYEWGAILRDFGSMGLIKDLKSVPSPHIVLNDGLDTVIRCKFTAEEAKLSGVSPLGIVICEAAKVSAASFEYLLGRTVGYNAWMYISGTFEKNLRAWYTAKFMEWLPGKGDAKAFSMRTYDNKILFPLGIDDPKIAELRKLSTDNFWQERIEGKPVPPLGLVYPQFDPELHIMSGYEYQPGEKLYLWYDPGYDHFGCLLFAQYYGGVVYVFDEIYKQGLTTRDFIQLAQNRSWWSNPDKHLVVDPNYANTHHAMSSVAETWLELTELVTYGDKQTVEEGIERVAACLMRNPETRGPLILFDNMRCQGALSEFGVIGRPPKGELAPYCWDMDDDGYKIGRSPMDRNNDAMDALRYGLVDLLGYVRLPYQSPRENVGMVSTPESRGDYGGFPNQEESGDGIHPSTIASTPESRGEVVVW